MGGLFLKPSLFTKLLGFIHISSALVEMIEAIMKIEL